MTIKKIKISSKSLNSSENTNLKPSTVTRAAITAEIKPTRGKQLVEHNPLTLIPDPSNPRPGDQIDDAWLKKYLLIGTENSLCRLDDKGNYIIPTFNELPKELPTDLEEDYDFLRNLAYSIRNEGLIEPIEIFLADKNNDPEYFVGIDLHYGYVVLEGHQRRLSGILAGVKTVTCIEITDETMLARLKVRHRKLRRQLSENNLRKGLTVSQNFKIVRELLKSDDCLNISNRELSSIIGLNEDIAGALKRLAVNDKNLPITMLQLIESNLVSFKWIRTWISKPYTLIDVEARRLLSGEQAKSEMPHNKVKARGRSGGAVKRSATFKVNKELDSLLLKNYLFQMIPALKEFELDDSPFYGLEKILNKLMEMAKSN